MKRLPAAPILALVAASVFGGGIVVAAVTTQDPRDPAPPAATRDVRGVVSIGRPITPYRAGAPPLGQVELRIRDPQGGARHAVLFHRYTHKRQGQTVEQECLEVGRERQLRRYPVRDGGSCRASAPSMSQPWSISITQSHSGPVMLHGWAGERVKRLTVAGPGGTFIVPRSKHGAFAVAYGPQVNARAVLTATLNDGSTRFFRSQIPPARQPEGAVLAADPGDLPSWYTSAARRGDGPRRGQTCLQVGQGLALQRSARRQGGNFLAPACGDLSRQAVFARTVQLKPSKRPSTFGPLGSAPRRTILAGAVDNTVKTVAVISPAGRRDLPLADAGRAFLAVFPATVKPADLTLEITLEDGQVRRFADSVSVNLATSRNPPPRLHGKIRLRQQPAATRRVILTARLTKPAKRFEITFLGRELRMRRTAGPPSRPLYTGIYDGTRGAQRPIVTGHPYLFSVLLCGDTCTVQRHQARLR